ncbi:MULTISPECIES: outer membrane protein assembly factor BamD [Flexistipes]|uniref:Outer membrane assembly lipoprotein YfiO n=1 Tax=Flexistipes sinusarabici (strain ATCC 49648 / DSM 4947 / MAS 10) TaxID=717231 RepID=F8E9P3_FLESM|nr:MULTISPECIES: outer membrane protein assembly factor BamD [Flexistipes]AEI14226.1 outer membrane assembly lipoprotein YfiO [Flexistipes sinusarabici DSM 4947]MEC9493165.1 outer membrane protein assembly factor BamD [Flexistipes sp.]
MKRIVLLLIASLMVFSCAGKNAGEITANELFQQGLNQFSEEDYNDAAKLFERTIMKANTPELAASAQLFLADSYFMMEDYAQAIPSYEQYLNIYGGSKEEPRVIYRLATSYYRLIPSIDRDQTNTRKALKQFEILEKKYPEFAKEKNTDKLINKLRNKLARKEMYIADFYFRIGEEEAAAARLKNIVENYKNTKVFPRAALRLSEYFIEKGKHETQAVTYLNSVLRQENGKQYLSEVSEMLDKLQKDMGSE